MRDLHGDAEQDCVAQLQPFNVYEMLPDLVKLSKCAFFIKITSLFLFLFEYQENSMVRVMRLKGNNPKLNYA